DYGDVGGVMLSVTIETNHDIRSEISGALKARVHGTSLSSIDRQPYDEGATGLCQLGRAVIRAIIDDDDLRCVVLGGKHHTGDETFLVVGGDHRDNDSWQV